MLSSMLDTHLAGDKKTISTSEQEIIQFSARHRLGSWLFDQLKTADLSPANGWTAATEKIGLVSAKRHLLMASELVAISNLLSKNGVRSLVLKGLALGYTIYELPTHRRSRDIDLLIDPCKFGVADQLLLASGYERYAPATDLTPLQTKIYNTVHNQFAYKHPQKKVNIELHWRLHKSGTRDQDIFESLYRDCETFQIENHQLNTLSSKDLLPYLLMHAAWHNWSALSWILDIRLLLKKQPELSSIELSHPARFAMSQFEMLAKSIWENSTPNSALPKELGWQALTSASESTSVIHALTKKKQQKNLLVEPGWKVKLLNGLFSTRDFELVKLPDTLIFVYPILKPFLFVYHQWVVKKA